MALDSNFWPALWNLAAASGTRPEVLLTVWFAESGLDPTAMNVDGCIGLNQTCPKELGGPGFPSTPEAYRASPASEQVGWIAPQVLAAVRKLKAVESPSGLLGKLDLIEGNQLLRACRQRLHHS